MPVSSTPSSSTTAHMPFRIRRSHLRLFRSGRNEQTSDSNSSHDVSLRSSGVAMSSEASSASITCSAWQSSTSAQPRLLCRRWRCETPIPREETDELYDVDNNNMTNNNDKEEPVNAGCRVDTFENEPDVDLLHQRLPSIEQRPVSRHVVYTVQYDGKNKSSMMTAKPSTVSSSFDSPRTLRQKAMQIDLNKTAPATLPHQNKDIKVKHVRRVTFPNDEFIDEWTKDRILKWLENVETAAIEDSVDSKTLSAIQEEAF